MKPICLYRKFTNNTLNTIFVLMLLFTNSSLYAGINLAVPSPPVATVATGSTASSFTANWTVVSGATSYKLDVSTSSTFGSFVSGYNNLTVGTNSKLVNSGLSAGTTYYYRVRAVNASGTSLNSNVISIVTIVPPIANNASNATTSSFRANWGSVSGSTGYRLDVSTSSSFASFLTGYNDLPLPTSPLYLNIPDLTAGTTYYYRVRAYKSTGASSNSNTKSVTTLPLAPLALDASNIGSTSFKANWNSVTGATSYSLDIATNNGFSPVLTTYNNISTNSYFVNTGLAANTTYYYRVKAVNGSGSSAYSTTKTLLTFPSVPFIDGSGNITDNSFNISWSGSTIQYQLDVSTSGSFPDFVPDYDGKVVNAYNYTITGLSSNTSYYCRVRSVNAVDTSANSSVYIVSTLPKAPVPNQATNITSSSFRANWTGNPGDIEYRLDVATNADFNVNSILSTYNNKVISGNYCNVSGLTSGATYYYRVRAVSATGTSASSGVITAYIGIPAIPVANPAASVTSGSFVASWNIVPGAASYQIDVSKNSNFTNFVGPYNNYSLTNNSIEVSSGIEPNTQYYYRVRTVNALGISASSNIVPVLSLLVTPVTLPATDIELTTFTANWMKVQAATEYHLDVSSTSDFLNILSNYNDLVISQNSKNITGLNAGTTYYYRIKVTNASNQSVYSITGIQATRKTDLLVTPPSTGILGQIPDYPIASSNGIVGAIPGSASVSGSGGASYAIPIEIPAGINGMQPQISIVYNSQAGKGLLGQGANLSCLSSITRAPDNPYYDNGTYGAVEYNSSDALSLDGQRLFLKSGTYFGNNSTYVTESDESTVVTLIAPSGSPDHFEVKTKSGSTIYYGNSPGSKINPVTVAGSPVYGWLVSKVVDLNGNYIEYTYQSEPGSNLLTEINYTGNASVAPFYKIKFNYADRGDIGFSYIGGSKLLSNKLLQTIEILYGTSLLKKYTFNYTFNSSTDINTLLTSISLENETGEHLNPTLLYWQQYNEASGVNVVNCEQGIAGDFNNDGLGDLFAIVKIGDQYNEKIFINNNGQLSSTSWTKTVNNYTKLSVDVFDFNGDGKSDVLNQSGTGYAILLSNGSSMTDLSAHDLGKNFKAAAGDFNGDGKDEVFLYLEDCSSKLLRYNNSVLEEISLTGNAVMKDSSYLKTARINTGDFDGDGRLDIGIFSSQGNFYPMKILNNQVFPIPFSNSSYGNNCQAADFNGDGVTDLADIDRNSWKVYFETNDHTTQGPEIITTAPDLSIANWIYGDLNYNNGQNQMNTMNLVEPDMGGGGDTTSTMTYTESLEYYTSRVLDVNADGKADIVQSFMKRYNMHKSNNSAFTYEDRVFLWVYDKIPFLTQRFDIL